MGAIPQTNFVRSGEVDLAYQVFGTGEDLVLIPGLPTHLEVMWELPELAAFLDRLASFRRVIAFDKRGTGMSDPVLATPVLEQHVDDVIAVMGAAGSVRASAAFRMSSGACAYSRPQGQRWSRPSMISRSSRWHAPSGVRSSEPEGRNERT